jgi:hypothetical protein
MKIISIGILLLIHLAIGFLVVFLLIVAAIFLYLSYKKRLFRKRERLKKKIYLLIEKALFYEPPSLQKTENNAWMKIPFKFQALLKKKLPRAVLRTEILQVQKNISGASRDNLQKLYEQLGLKQDALKKLNRFRQWYIKAEGIQELSIMNQRDCLRSIYRYVNDKNEYIRMEAQSAAINFLGFHGLRFLNIISYPLSEWQQLKLLEQLSHKPVLGFKGITAWLQSPNDSVITFALKLVRVYRCFELHDTVAKCMEHPNVEVKKSCIITLTDIYTEDTAPLLIWHYATEDTDCRLATLHALCQIRDPETISFLTEQLQDENNDLKLAAAKAIMATAGSDGINVLNAYTEAQSHPWHEIIQQLKAEAAV